MAKQNNDDFGQVLTLLQQVSASVDGQTRAQTQAQTLLSAELGEMKATISSLKEQTDRIERSVNNHSGIIRTIEMDNAGWKSEFKNVWGHVKRLNAFMDFARNKNLDVDTGMIDVRAQQVQHAAEMAIRDSSGDMKRLLFKFGPWILIAMFAASAVGGALSMKLLASDDIVKRIEKVEDTNPGSR